MESRGAKTSISMVRVLSECDGLQFVVFDQDIIALATLIAFNLVVLLHRLAGDGIDILADDAVAGFAIEGVETDLLIFGYGRHHRDRAGHE